MIGTSWIREQGYSDPLLLDTMQKHGEVSANKDMYKSYMKIRKLEGYKTPKSNSKKQ